jgi:CRISPR-associated protein Cas5d
MSLSVTIKVFGESACFTCADAKTERETYEVPTASALRGILEAYHWHPGMIWRPDSLKVLKPIEIESWGKSELNIKRTPFSGPINANDIKNRMLRNTSYLMDVAYIINATAVYRYGDPNMIKHAEQFRRRVKKGAYHHSPYLGLSECVCFGEMPDGTEQPINVTKDLGRMLLDFEYGEDVAIPRFCEIMMVNGVITFPKDKLSQIYDAQRLLDIKKGRSIS